MKSNLQKLQSYQRSTNQARIDSGVYRLLKIKAKELNTTVKDLVEGCVAELLEVKK